ncbi:hypothetical protein CDAR_13141 [Caerostris darwini]|uniref:Uncharacterized protein n=1 Tax=Caerostris darwini TaxID=1538125 RepID=A0AAV4VUW3_9ARAC|nr:hypothetical protein CDAR_13141 [Caerostris darwini]
MHLIRDQRIRCPCSFSDFHPPLDTWFSSGPHVCEWTLPTSFVYEKNTRNRKQAHRKTEAGNQAAQGCANPGTPLMKGKGVAIQE